MGCLTKPAFLILATLLLSCAVQCQEEQECWDEEDMSGNLLGGLGPLGDVFGAVLSGGGLDIIGAAIKCAAEYAKNVNFCSANSTLDPFAVARKCAADTGFGDLAEQIQNMWPKKESPIFFPEFKEHARCFVPDPSLFLQGAMQLASGAAGGVAGLADVAGGGGPLG